MLIRTRDVRSATPTTCIPSGSRAWERTSCRISRPDQADGHRPARGLPLEQQGHGDYARFLRNISCCGPDDITVDGGRKQALLAHRARDEEEIVIGFAGAGLAPLAHTLEGHLRDSVMSIELRSQSLSTGTRGRLATPQSGRAKSAIASAGARDHIESAGAPPFRRVGAGHSTCRAQGHPPRSMLSQRRAAPLKPALSGARHC